MTLKWCQRKVPPPLPVFLEDAAQGFIMYRPSDEKRRERLRLFGLGQRVWKEQVYLLSLHYISILIQIWIDRNLLVCADSVSLSLSLSLFNKWVCLRVSTRRAPVDRQLHSPFYLPGETRNSRAIIPHSAANAAPSSLGRLSDGMTPARTGEFIYLRIHMVLFCPTSCATH